MLLCLEDGGATYKRTMIIIFLYMLHDCLEDYVNVIVMKYKEVYHRINDLRKFFTRCGQYNLQMNPFKCAFSASSEKFLGVIVHRKVIDLNPPKSKAIRDMDTPTTI